MPFLRHSVAAFVWVQCTGALAGTIQGIGTAGPDVISIVVEAPVAEAPPTQSVAQWKVNGTSPVAVGRNSYVWDQAATSSAMTMRHHLYLRLAAPLVENADYAVTTPYGNRAWRFRAAEVVSEAIKVNQVGYAAFGSPYAVYASHLGDLPTNALSQPPHYRVRRVSDNSVVVEGTGMYRGFDNDGPVAGGEHVYHLALGAVPEGGPYFVVVDGVGRSPPFGMGASASREIAYVVTRGLYHQRCGMALATPYTVFTRGLDHTQVQVTDAEPPGFITMTGPMRSVAGGYHDAGDFDRRQAHTLIPAWLLTLFDAYPSRFGDGQFNLPESGNGVPDWLDEALWGVRQWEALQEADGGVRAGTETTQHPTYGAVDAATDTLVYRTYRRDGHATASAAGMFAQAARLVAPFDAARAQQLQSRALSAWNWLQSANAPSAHTAQRMYAALQLYLLTGQPTYHDAFRAAVTQLSTAGWPQQYHMAFFNLNTIVDGMVFSPYFAPYLWTQRPTDAATRQVLMQWLRSSADGYLNADPDQPYGVGATTSVAWGGLTGQGRYADPMIYLYRVTGEGRYRDAVARLANYPLGLNPLGKSYITGLGSNPPVTPLHLDSWFTRQRGLGVVPGITVYGPVPNPSSISYQQQVWSQAWPAWSSRPPARRYSEGWSFVAANEFTTWETMAPNAVMYAFLLPDFDRIFADGFAPVAQLPVR
ncbi:glycoside hydrolase family 9 protein [Tahibacter amnicola]|uniref:Glycoside hydrolase family 9 protein n=1 Tax=Tahibacter amnicola TaxID=2976241 RepID=A0ABY6BNW7_9GAMM|nr:glycoside hydrolase family 9 protein [Tahibacter amnicola]UXI70256.1 glycoside hydrolase family 9 protein [Tahibacter amnicola]